MKILEKTFLQSKEGLLSFSIPPSSLKINTLLAGIGQDPLLLQCRLCMGINITVSFNGQIFDLLSMTGMKY